MYILALETTGKYGSAAVINSLGKITCVSSSEEMNHLQDVINLTDEALIKADIDKHEITHVAASVGPGSFTGIRIGVSTARAISQMMNIPCVSVSTLEGMAMSAIRSGVKAPYIATVINARRRQTYAAVWQVENGVIAAAVLPEKQYMIEEVCEFLMSLEGDILFTGDGIDAYSSIIDDTLKDNGVSYEYMDETHRYQLADGIAMLAKTKATSDDVLSYNELLPNYMRKSEAEMRLEQGTLSKKIRG